MGDKDRERLDELKQYTEMHTDDIDWLCSALEDAWARIETYRCAHKAVCDKGKEHQAVIEKLKAENKRLKKNRPSLSYGNLPGLGMGDK